MRLLLASVIVGVMAGCGGAEPAARASGDSTSTITISADAQWQAAGTLQRRPVEIDVGTMTIRGDTVHVKGRILGEKAAHETQYRDMEVACSTSRFRHMDKDREWQALRRGPPEMIAAAACEEAKKRGG